MQHTYIILQQPVFSSPEAVAAHSKKEQYVHKLSSKHLIFFHFGDTPGGNLANKDLLILSLSPLLG